MLAGRRLLGCHMAFIELQAGFGFGRFPPLSIALSLSRFSICFFVFLPIALALSLSPALAPSLPLLSLPFVLYISPYLSICFTRSRSFADGHTVSNAPDLFRPPKLSGTGPGQYWGGGPPGKPLGCCQLFIPVG